MNIAVVFGGKSGEHEVSLVSASSIARNIPADRNRVILIGITKDGAWYLQDEAELVTLRNKGSVPLEPQDSSKATYAPPIEKHEGRIDWSRTTEEIICQIHAMTPWPSAYTRHRGFEIKIVQGEPFEIEPGNLYAPGADIPAGEIVMLIKGRGFAVRTRDGALLVKRVQLPGKKAIEAGALLNAGVIKEGDMLS